MAKIQMQIPKHVPMWVIAGILTIAAFFSSAASAQNDLPGETIDLPSVSEYRLPPGEQGPTQPAAEGPTTENGTPPRPTGSQNPAPTNTPAPAAASPAPVVRSPEGSGNSAGQQPRPIREASSSGPASPVQRSAASQGRSSEPVPTNEPSSVNPADATNSSGNPSGIIANETAISSTDELTEPTESEPAETVTEGNSTILYMGLGAALLVLVVSIYAFLRRKRTQLVLEEAIAEPTRTPRPSKNAATTAKPLKLQIEPREPTSPAPQPVKRTPVPANGSGFVTSKIGTPAKATPKPNPPVSPPMASPKTNIAIRPGNENLEIALIPKGASSTLLNAVLNYTVMLTNTGKQPITDIKLLGLMMQADQEAAQHGTNAKTGTAASPVHVIGTLAPDETIEFSDDIRLPLSVIRPISFQSQALFIPLARFTAEYVDENGDTINQVASFIVGEEHQPPRPKLAPFRLDLGPRSFGPLGQRPLKI